MDSTPLASPLPAIIKELWTWAKASIINVETFSLFFSMDRVILTAWKLSTEILGGISIKNQFLGNPFLVALSFSRKQLFGDNIPVKLIHSRGYHLVVVWFDKRQVFTFYYRIVFVLIKTAPKRQFITICIRYHIDGNLLVKHTRKGLGVVYLNSC